MGKKMEKKLKMKSRKGVLGMGFQEQGIPMCALAFLTPQRHRATEQGELC